MDLRKLTNEYKDLYRATLPTGNPIQTYITQCAINDELPDETEIADAVNKLKNGKAPGHPFWNTSGTPQTIIKSSKERECHRGRPFTMGTDLQHNTTTI
jgi:hypothetical protein